MGYITVYELRVIEGNESLIAEFREECEEAKWCLDDEGNCNDSGKWYESDSDMEAFSKKHPEALFELSGDGEESTDIWKQYWRNGKVQHCQGVIVYDEYDESKMK